MREMKDSGVPWIGEVPANWEIVPLKSRFSFYKGLPITKADLTETGIAIISYGQIHSKMNSGTHVTPDLIRFVPDKYLHDSPQSLTQNGDILFADTSEDYSGIGNCVLVDVDPPLFAGYHTIIARPQDCRHSKYLAYLFQTDNWRSQLRLQASGIKVYSVTQKMLKTLSIVLPPVEVGERMTAYLDTKCAKIDAIIAKQLQVIEKLKAYKLSVITEAVTKGLNPDVPMKDSGIKWIGMIPAHWDAIPLKLYTDILPGYAFSSHDFDTENGIPLLRGINITPNGIRWDDVVRWGKEVSEQLSFYELQCGDIVVGLDRPWVSDGTRITWVTDGDLPSLLLQRVCRIRAKSDMDKRWVYHWIASNAFKDALSTETTGVSVPHISTRQIGQFVVAYPPVKEQQQICNFLEKQVVAVDKTISRKQELIDKLTEYKKSFIYEVVTGKREINADLSAVTSVAVLAPALIAELREKRAALMTRFIDGLGDKNKGRTQIQKCMSIAEGLIDLQLGIQFVRQHYGPYDEDIRTYEQIMAGLEWVNHAKKKGKIQYTHGKTFQEYHSVYQRLSGNYDREIQQIIDFVKPIKHTSEIGRMATLFAAWNDFILDGIPNPTDEQIISEVRRNWTDNKANTPVKTWQDSLNKLQAAGIVPHGYGRHTVKLEEGDRTHG